MLQVAAPTTLGTYSWEFTYNGNPIPSTNTALRTEGGCGIAATTDILKDQPSPTDISSANGETSMSFGVDQYSAQESGCTGPG